jgi:pimeloyl-ACP methyl ester carboxylesterase
MRWLYFLMVASTGQWLYAQAPQQSTGQGHSIVDGLHLSCVGGGRPVVILEAGAGRGVSDWAKVQPAIGGQTEVCSYDRHPDHCCDDVIDDLRSMLRKASLPGPYVLVGHSLGGLYVRRFAGLFPDDVAGLVLVDSSDEKQLTGIIAPGLKPELYRPGAMSDAELQAFFRDIGTRMKAAGMAPAAESTSGADSGDSGEIRMARFYRQIAADRREPMFGDTPVIVLTATKMAAMPRFSDDQRSELDEDHRALQARMRLLSKNSKQVLVPNSGHYVQLDNPDAVIAAVLEVVAAVRNAARLVR